MARSKVPDGKLSVSLDGANKSPAAKRVRVRPTALPKRKKRKGSYLTVTGKFCTTKNTFLVPFEGLRERDFFALLEFDDRVARFTAQPMTLPVGTAQRRYTPDVLVEFCADDRGTVPWPEVCEVKLSKNYRQDEDELRAKYQRAEELLAKQHKRFRLITEEVIRQPLVANLYFLLPYRRYPSNDVIEHAIRVALDARPLSANEVVDTLDAVGHESLVTISQMWRLLSTRMIATELDQPLTMESVLWNGEWSVADALARPFQSNQPTWESGSMAFASDEARAFAATLDGVNEGPVVVELTLGGLYARTGIPGVYKVVQIDSPEFVVVEEVGSGALSTSPTSELRPVTQAARQRHELLDLSDEQRQQAQQILASVQPFLERGSRIRLDEAKVEAEKLGVKHRTWLKWVRQYREHPSLSTLVRSPRSDRGQSRLDQFVQATIANYVDRWVQNQTKSIKEHHQELVDFIDEFNASHQTAYSPPEYSTFYLKCKDVPEITRVAGLSGKRIAKLKHGLRQGALGDVLCPLSFVQIDHTEINVNVVDEEHRIYCGRPWITVAIDVFSRMIVGFYLSLTAPGNLQLGRVMVHVILSKAEYLKQHGIDVPWPCSGYPSAVHADNAGEFQGNMMELAAQEHGFHLYFRKLKHPNYGGHIENYLGNLSNAIKTLPGWVPQDDDELGERDPRGEATMTLRELERWLILKFAEYHAAPHSALQKQSPVGRWHDGCRGSATHPGLGSVRFPANVTKLHIDFLPVEERVVDSTGIVLDYIHYQSPHLQRWVGARDPEHRKLARKFRLRRDPRDLSVIYFWDPDELRYVAIPYRTPSRPRITLWELNEVRKAIAKKNVSEIDENLIFRVREELRRAIEKSTEKSALQKRAKASEARRVALADARKLQDDLISGLAYPSATPSPAAGPQAQSVDEDLLDNNANSFEAVL